MPGGKENAATRRGPSPGVKKLCRPLAGRFSEQALSRQGEAIAAADSD